QPTMPKRKAWSSRIGHYLLTVQSSNEVRVRVLETGARGKGGCEACLVEKVWQVIRAPAVRIGKCPGAGLELADAVGGGANLRRARSGLDPVEPGMAAAVTAEVHAAGSHFPDLLAAQIVGPGDLLF